MRLAGTIFPVIAVIAAPAFAADLAAPLTAEVVLTDVTGGKIDTVLPGQPFGIDVTLTDAATGGALKGFVLEGWIRPVSETDAPCVEAARAFRATRRIPTGGIDLNGIVLAGFNDDGSFGLADPRLDLATANMLAAGTLEVTPDLVVADRAGQRLIAHLPGHEGLVSVGLTGDVSGIALPEVGGTLAALHVSNDGVIWLGGIGTDGRGVMFHAPGGDEGTPVRFQTRVGGLADAGEGEVFAWAEDGFAFLDASSGQVTASAGYELASNAAGIALPDGRGGVVRLVATLAPDRVSARIVFADAPMDSVSVELAAPADRIDISPETGMILVWNADGAVSFIDPATTALAGAVALNQGIGDAVFAGEAAFLATADQSGVTVIDLGTVAVGQAPTLREVRLAPRDAEVTTRPGALLVPLAPSPQVLAVHAASYTGFVIDETSSMGDAPPMTAVRLRGGRPSAVAVLDRSFRETAPGRFNTRAVVNEGGPHELVLTTGIGGMSRCFRFDAEGPKKSAFSIPVLTVELGLPSLAARAGQVLNVRLLDEDGASVALTDPVLEMTHIQFGWRATLTADGFDAGGARFIVAPPVPGHYAVTLADAKLKGVEIRATTIEAKQ